MSLELESGELWVSRTEGKQRRLDGFTGLNFGDRQLARYENACHRPSNFHQCGKTSFLS